MAVSWDSQTDTIYEIESSLDMESWKVEAEGIEGNGERLTHFFLRAGKESYYRVREKASE